MSQSIPVIILNTGPNRGLGHAFLTNFLKRDNHIVIAAARDPTEKKSQELLKLERAKDTKLHLIKIDSAIESDASVAIKELEEEKEITYIDTIIVNAGLDDTGEWIPKVALKDVHRHIDINLFGPLSLFPAAQALLEASKSGNPKFVTMTSGLSSMALMEERPGPWFCSGVSKVTQNYMVRKIHYEYDWVTAVALNPGWVNTDMGKKPCEVLRIDLNSSPVSIEESVRGCLEVIDGASRDQHGVQCIEWDGKVMPW